MRLSCILVLGVSILLASPAWSPAQSGEAAKLRKNNSLSEFAPPETFLNGNFVADEVDPAFIFGRVKDFARSRSCPATWLIEEGEKKRIASLAGQPGPVEYTLYLEEDCPGKVVYYVFVDRSGAADTAQWLDWRKQFHKNKAEPQYGAAKAGLEKALGDGFPVNAELRFIEFGGELSLQTPETILAGERKVTPVYDLRQGKALSR